MEELQNGDEFKEFMEENPDLLREFGFKNYEGRLVVDREKALGKPVAKDVDCPALWCDKVEEVYDAG